MENDASNSDGAQIRPGPYKDTNEEDPCEKCPERQFYPNCDSNFPCPFKAGLDDAGDAGEAPLEPETSWRYSETEEASPERTTTSYEPEEEKAAESGEERGEDTAS